MAGSLRSCRHHGVIYIAKRSRRGSRKFLWSFMPVAPIAADIRVEARGVPNQIRPKSIQTVRRRSKSQSEDVERPNQP
jgi:hypothetical protein